MPELLLLVGDATKARNDNHERLPVAFRAAGWQVRVADHDHLEIRAGTLCLDESPLQSFDLIWPLGFGRLFASFKEDNDGTIAVSETRIDGATDHLVMPVSHKGLLVSSDVADQIGSFLKRGEFLRDI